MGYFRFVLLSLFVFLCSIVQAKILILSDDPADEFLFVQEGPKDIASDSYRLLFDHLKQLDFDLQIAPIARVNAILSGTEPVCAINRIKTTERALYHLYSYPIHLYPSHRLYYFKNRTVLPESLFNHRDELINLPRLMNHFPHARIAKEASKSYGPILDAQFQLLSDEQLITRAGGDAYAAMVAMFEKHRVDFLVSYPTVFKQYAHAPKNEDIRSVSIANHPSFIAGHIACSQTPQSEEIIKLINETLLQLYPSHEFLNLHLNHVPPSEHEILRRRISDLYLNRQNNA
ncbi:hypothetical protein NI389_09290 [Pseudoalteromonas xiamenensis]|uniref:hypothetical protein n=1 Tax=Pseudoalteromonas xiamenensis TaxID=882626 RepID=UPI0027E3D512|nr:hypothetical protein [Pseudoalteromonas xiamenensis]WMN58464.1 hypothetical protein NI389_09290 [Pseudoalteromonas xiamenensis]